MFTSAGCHTEVLILCDSGTNAHKTPLKEDLRKKHTVNRSYTFKNKSQLQVLAMRGILVHVNVQGKEFPIKVKNEGHT